MEKWIKQQMAVKQCCYYLSISRDPRHGIVWVKEMYLKGANKHLETGAVLWLLPPHYKYRTIS